MKISGMLFVIFINVRLTFCVAVCDWKSLRVNLRHANGLYMTLRRVPWYLSRWVFWLASFVLLSWPLRILVQYKIAYVHYYIHKVFGVASGQRDSSIVNSWSDIALPNNNTLIPSYSEAMRMDHCGRTASTEQLTVAPTASVDLGPDVRSSALLPLLRDFRRSGNDSVSLLPTSAVGTSRTIYGTVVYDHDGRAFFRSRPPHHTASVSAQSWSTRDADGAAASGGARSRRREAAVQKRKRRRSYNEAVGAPSGSETSLAATRFELRSYGQSRGRRRASSAGHASVSGIATSMSTPESFDKLQNASAWVEELRHVKSFVEGDLRTSVHEVGSDNDAVTSATRETSPPVAEASTDNDRVTTAAATVNAGSELLAHSAYDVIGRRVVRCRREWLEHITDDDDDDLPPSYEDALRMRVVQYDVTSGVHFDDISSVSTASTYLSSELPDTPRRWKTFVRRPYARADLPPFHVETSL